MFSSIRSFRPTRSAALIAAAIVLAAASGASARSTSGNGGHSDGHRASLASTPRVMSPPIIATKPGDKHHHHARFRFFGWYQVNPCAVYDPRYVTLSRVEWLARCRVIQQPVVY
jgi:hypothetical protein